MSCSHVGGKPENLILQVFSNIWTSFDCMASYFTGTGDVMCSNLSNNWHRKRRIVCESRFNYIRGDNYKGFVFWSESFSILYTELNHTECQQEYSVLASAATSEAEFTLANSSKLLALPVGVYKLYDVHDTKNMCSVKVNVIGKYSIY